MFKWVFWLGVLAAAVFVGGQVIPVYYNNLKIENVFEGVAKTYGTKPEARAKSRVRILFDIQSIDLEILPPDFFENLVVTKEGEKLQISAEYHVVLWLLGPPESIDPDKDYKESEVKPMDKLRLRARMDFDFAPYAETP